MPYIITTTTKPAGSPPGSKLVRISRRAVATLDEARAVAEQINELPASGGTIGPLPDGTIIEVRRVGIATLASIVPAGSSISNVVDAYNAAQ